MGMFDKDKEIGTIITSLFNQGEHFILWDARITREDFPTNLGPTPQATLTVSKIDNPQERFDATTLASAIAAKVREAESDDFPAIVTLRKVQSRFGNDALVIQFLKPYGGPFYPEPRGSSSGARHPDVRTTTDDDIPF